MSGYDSLDEKIKKQLNLLIESSGLENSAESLELLADNWINKENLFVEQVHALQMQLVEYFNKQDNRPVLIFTYSGSLIAAFSITNNSREIEYYSIKFRKDVPEVIKIKEANFLDDVKVDIEATFSKGLKKTSKVYKIAVCNNNVPIDEQNKRIKEAVIFLTNGFLKLNKSLYFDKNEIPELFTKKMIVKFIANKNNLNQKEVKKILVDYLYLIECGLLLKEKIQLGRIGKLFLKKRSSQKARIGINPKTGEKITIHARPEMYIPKFKFSKIIKEKASALKIENE